MVNRRRRASLYVILVLGVCLAASAGWSQGRQTPKTAGAPGRLAQITGRITLAGLERPVEVIRDRWGVPHIYAQTTDDLFFAQGFVVAQDRLWQLEMWRRTGEGRLAEVLGEKALPRDIFARLLLYRGDMEAEWASYAPDARRIVTAFVRGVNALIALDLADGGARLPVEFSLMGLRPDPWTPEVCLTRVAGYVMSRNIENEVLRAQLVSRIGTRKAAELMPLDPPAELRVAPGLDLGAITPEVLAGHRAAGTALSFVEGQGSNNWTVAGSRTRSGRPILANDPHRQMLLPSLRYMAHLVGPGWNVIGAGEPALPGLAAGHNERTAYGFTIFAADQQDLFVERTDPANPLRYRYAGKWETMRTVKELFRVKGKDQPVEVELRYTRHGPVIHEDREKRLAYALRWTGLEPGGAGYLASLSLNRARDWTEFRKALERWKIPAQNIVYADVEGNIGYQAAGLVPARSGWNGLLPVPGDSGRYEWTGFRKLEELPHAFNPPKGFVATANHRTVEPNDPHPAGYEFGADYRFRRIEEVLGARRDFSIADMQRLQHDQTSLVARQLVPMLAGAKTADPRLSGALRLLREWDQVLSADSAAAALYEIWVQKLVGNAVRQWVPAQAQPLIRSARTVLGTAIVLLERHARDRLPLLLDSLREADADLSERMGSDMSRWRWGALHRAEFRHPLAAEFNLPAVPRGGDSNTVNATGFAADFRQITGASYRQIFDVGQWDNSVGINVPGQSGRPGSPHYGDLLAMWAAGEYFPLAYSREAVERYAASRLLLEPAAGAQR